MALLARLPLRLSWLLVVAGIAMGAGLHPGEVAADDTQPVNIGGNKGTARFEAVVRVDQGGVSIEVRARRSTPGSNPSLDQPGSITQPVSSGPGSGGGTSSAIVKSWFDPTTNTYFSQTSSGLVYSLEPVNLGSPSTAPGGWFQEGQQRYPNSTPMIFSVDGVFQGIVWVPNTSSGSNTNWGTPPANSAPPGGNGASTNPSEVALDLFGHVPMPDIQLRANPALGLVALPGWFWVEGYDGSPFGASRTVVVPPEVGDNVPLTVVPADDPRRQPTSFTVSVRVWPARYEWRFGDGGGLVATSLGRPYPGESEIKHAYERSSLQHPDGFPVSLTVEFAAEFSVDGGGGQGLPSIIRTYELGYRVQEIQSVLTGR